MEIKELTKNEWDNFLNYAPHASIYQTSEYGLAFAKQYKPLFIGLVDDQEKIIAGALILVKKLFNFNYGYVPRGFLIDYNDSILLETFTEKLKTFLLEYNITALKLSPPIKKNTPNYQQIFSELKRLNYWHFGYNDFFEGLNPRYEVFLNLEKPIEKIYYNLNPATVQKIEDAVKQGVIIYRGGVEDATILHNQIPKSTDFTLKTFQDLYLHFNKNAQISIYYAKINTGLFLKNIQKDYRQQEQIATKLNNLVFEKNKDLKIVGKKIEADQKLAHNKELLVKATNINNQRPEGINVASALVVTFKTDVYILIEGSLSEYKNFNAKYLLYWKIIEKYKNLGYQRLFFGGITNPNIKDKRYQTLNDEKLSFSTEILEFAGDFELIINKSKYYLFKKRKAISGVFK